MAKWLFGGLFIGVAAIFIAVGVYFVVAQDRLIRNARSTTAVIESSQVKTETYRKDGRTRTRTSAEIRYRYRVDGQWKEGMNTHPGLTSSGSAEDLVAQFPTGKQVTAWYDKRDPSSAFLIKRYDFAPYLFILFPMIHLSIGVLVAGAMEGKLPPAPVQRGGRFELAPETPLGRKLKYACGMTALWWGAGLMACGHFYAVAERPMPTFAIVASAIYFTIGLVPLGFAWHYWRLSVRLTAEPSVTVDRYPLVRGQPVAVRVSVPLAGGGSVEEARVILQCRQTVISRSGGKSSTSTSTKWEEIKDFARAQDVMSDRTLAGEVTFVVPGDEPAGTPAGERGYPRYKWRLFVKVKQPGPDYSSGFAVEVL